MRQWYEGSGDPAEQSCEYGDWLEEGPNPRASAGAAGPQEQRVYSIADLSAMCSDPLDILLRREEEEDAGWGW